MTDKKGWGSTVMGWFVVKEDGESPSADAPAGGILSDAEIEAMTRRSVGTSSASTAPVVVSKPKPLVPGAAPSGPLPVPPSKDLPPAPGGKVDFEKVFESFGVDAEKRDRFGKAGDLLRSLPEGTDLLVKKQIVEASLKAFSIPIDKIIEAGVEQLQALESYQRTGAADTSKVCDEADRRIREFEEEIKRIRQVMEERVREQQAVIASTNQRKLEIQKVLEFFGQEAVARVVKASPKLVDPAAKQ